MTRLLFVIAFLIGAIAVLWMGSSFIGSDMLALTVTIVIGCVYTLGFAELVQFRQATSTLAHALRSTPDIAAGDTCALDEWLTRLHPSLQNPVRLRIEGERVGLPAPIMTPYLVGLLVMLGLLGTFVGMVDTLKGAVFALEGTTELQAIRAGLAAPINGLSLAFGTSVAGVAASAMLGLISTLSRRERMLETRLLDTRVTTVFRSFSLTHNRMETFKALQVQAQALPEVAEQLQSLAVKLADMGDNLGKNLIANQNLFHESVERAYSGLASAVDETLRNSLTESGRQAGDIVKPIVVEAMAGIASEAQNTHQKLTQTAQQQLTALGSQFEQQSISMRESFETSSASWIERQESSDLEKLKLWTQALEQVQEQTSAQFLDSSTLLTSELKQVSTAQQASFESATRDFESMSGALTAQWLSAATRMDELTSALKSELGTLRAEEEQRGQAAIERLASLESTVASQLVTLGRGLEEPMTRLIETASETPRAAAEVIGQLRHEISNTLERDNQLLEERRRIMEELQMLSNSLEQSSAGQREAIEQLVASSTNMLQSVSSGFTQQVGQELSNLSVTADNFAGSALEMSSLGDSFTLAVNLFNESNSKLMENLARIEESMNKTTTRSDEQMGYYVAQAREIIDQSLLSQREVFEKLHQFDRSEDTLRAEAS